MGRTVGFEPTHNGTTIHGLNRLTMPATTFLFNYQLIKHFQPIGISKYKHILKIK